MLWRNKMQSTDKLNWHIWALCAWQQSDLCLSILCQYFCQTIINRYNTDQNKQGFWMTITCKLQNFNFFPISQFVISEGAWNCGRKSGVSKVNCDKFESITVRACRSPVARSIQCTWLHNKRWFKANSEQKTLAWLKLILLLFGGKLDLANL